MKKPIFLIGQIVTIGGKFYKVMEGSEETIDCWRCAFQNENNCTKIICSCEWQFRTDLKQVYFAEYDVESGEIINTYENE